MWRRPSLETNLTQGWPTWVSRTTFLDQIRAGRTVKPCDLFHWWQTEQLELIPHQTTIGSLKAVKLIPCFNSILASYRNSQTGLWETSLTGSTVVSAWHRASLESIKVWWANSGEFFKRKRVQFSSLGEKKVDASYSFYHQSLHGAELSSLE